MDRRLFLKTLGVIGALAAGSGIATPAGARALHEAEALLHRLIGLAPEVDRSSSPSWRAAVIGAGVAGLAAARTLAQAGWQVDVFEKAATIGGFCSTVAIEGFTFDLGPHVFHGSIRHLVPFKPGDLDCATFSESFLLDGRILSFPNDLLSPGYVADMVATLARNTWNPSRFEAKDLESLAAASYGERAASEIFKPLIQKWCGAPLNSLDRRYFASRMHSRLNMDLVRDYLRRGYAEAGQSVSRSFGRAGNPPPPLGPDGIPDAPGYAGSTGAQVVPHRLAEGIGNLRIHPNRPVRALGVERGRIVWLEADGLQIRPDFVVSTAPLNRVAEMIRGADHLKALAQLRYLNVVFVFARIRRDRLLSTEWSWIPDDGVPFYRMSEMKVLNRKHSPTNATGLCLEVTLPDYDPRLKEPDLYWKRLATEFLKRVFGLQERDIIGIDVQIRECAYPDFTVPNTELIAGVIEEPYRSGQTSHRFRTGIENLALAGRAGTFIYLLTPWAIMSGLKAAEKAQAYAAGQDKRPRERKAMGRRPAAVES